MKQLVLLLFFLSGACGLVYEVVWTRVMTHVFGTTALAVGTVLAAFMSGLALGSWLLGRLADRSKNPLRLYAMLEVGVGLAVLVAHFLILRITPAYLAVYEWFGRSDLALGAARFVLGFVLVMAPTMLMGATLPVLARFVVTRRSQVGTGLSTVYAINTLGAVGGTLIAGFVLIRTFGQNGTVYLAILGNLVIGGVAWFASMRVALAEAPEEEPAPRKKTADREPVVSAGTVRLLLIALAISGMTSFAYEIYWTRALVFLVGNSTYAVSTMLTAFLLGIALGGYLVRFLVERIQSRMALLGVIQVLIAVTAVAALPMLFALGDPDTIKSFVGQASDQAGFRMLSRFGVALVVMLVPATLIGTIFPLAGRIGVRNLQQTGSTVGRIYAANTVGNVVGALLPGLILLAWLGIQRGILLMAALNACLGVMLFAWHSRARWIRVAVPVLFATIAFLALRKPPEFQLPAADLAAFHRVEYYREGPSATTMVYLDPDTRERSMAVDGIDIGGTGNTNMKQQLLAHLPKLLMEDVSRELSVGFGSGILAGESARHPRVQSITCVEIEPSVVEGAAYFADNNHGVLEDPRLELVVDDVANHLRTTPNRYQVISADEKTSEEYASNGFSYSKEYYQLLREVLAPGGMMIQWVPTSLPTSQFAMALRTFSEAFPYMQVWCFPPALQYSTVNTILIGSNEPVTLDLALTRRLLDADREYLGGVTRYGLTSAEAVLAHYVADGPAVRQGVAGTPLNTLDRPRYEFFSADDYAIPSQMRSRHNHQFLADLKRLSMPAYLESLAKEGVDLERMQQALAAEEAYLEGFIESLVSGSSAKALAAFESALRLAPWNDSLRARVFLEYQQQSTHFTSHRSDDPRRATDALAKAFTIFQGTAMNHVNYGLLLSRQGAPDRAEQEYRLALTMRPDLVAAHRMLAQLLAGTNRIDAAQKQLGALLKIEPDDAGARRMLFQLQQAPGPRPGLRR